MTKEEEKHEEKLCEECQLDVAVKGCWNCDRLLCESCAFSHLLPRRQRSHRIVEANVLLEQREKDRKFRRKLREEHEKAREEFEKEELRKEEERREAAVYVSSSSRQSLNEEDSSIVRARMYEAICSNIFSSLRKQIEGCLNPIAFAT